MRGRSVLNTPFINCKKSPWEVCKHSLFFQKTISHAIYSIYITSHLSQVKRSSQIQHVVLSVNFNHFTAFQTPQHSHKIFFCTFFPSLSTAHWNLHEGHGFFSSSLSQSVSLENCSTAQSLYLFSNHKLVHESTLLLSFSQAGDFIPAFFFNHNFEFTQCS